MRKSTPWTRTIGRCLRELRASRHETQEDMAEHLGITPSTYKKYEAGTVMMPLSTVCTICEHYSVSADLILARAAFTPTAVKSSPLSPLARKIARSLSSTSPRLLTVMRSIQRLELESESPEDFPCGR